MFEVTDTKIMITRGDSGAAELILKRKKDHTIYEPVQGDSIIFAVKSKLNAARTEYIEEKPLVSKEISVSDMTLRLDPADTKGLKFGSYYYDVEVTLSDGRVDTVINNAPFIVLPGVV